MPANHFLVKLFQKGSGDEQNCSNCSRPKPMVETECMHCLWTIWTLHQVMGWGKMLFTWLILNKYCATVYYHTRQYSLVLIRPFCNQIVSWLYMRTEKEVASFPLPPDSTMLHTGTVRAFVPISRLKFGMKSRGLRLLLLINRRKDVIHPRMSQQSQNV